MGVDLLFVDGEDWGSFDPDASGGYPDALFGSQHFANNLPLAGLQAAVWRVVRHDRRRGFTDL